ncbi:MAG: PAS domain-containing protein [Desulfobacteraceae bacterium]|nr:MAG: PAS domain-containing protein [Desulfobacteraceae bacterium]
MGKSYREQIEEQRLRDNLSSEIRMNCTNAALLIKYFSEKYVVSPRSLVSGLSVSEEYLKDTSNWLNNLDTYKLYYNCHHSVEGFTHHDWTEVGRSVYRSRISGFFRTIVRFVPLKKLYTRIPFYNQRMSKFSRYTVAEESKGFIRYKFEIPEPRIRRLFSIGCECNWHIGILSSFPKIQNPSDSLSQISHEICAMGVTHLLMWCYGLFEPQWAIVKDGVLLNGELIAKWVRLKSDRNGLLSGVYEFSEMSHANATVILKDVPVNGVTAFRRGEIYGAPYCLFSVNYKEVKPFRRLFPKSVGVDEQTLEKQLLLTERKFFEAEELRRREKAAEEILKSERKRLEETAYRLEYLDYLLESQNIRIIVFDSRLQLADFPKATKQFLHTIVDKGDEGMLQTFYGWIHEEIAPTGTLKPGTGPWERILDFHEAKIRCEAHIIIGRTGSPSLIITLREHSRSENFAALRDLRLTRREIEVLEYLPLGYTNRQIAAALGLQPVSVKKHLKNAAEKLHASGRTEILYQALKAVNEQRLQHNHFEIASKEMTALRVAEEALRLDNRTLPSQFAGVESIRKKPDLGMCMIDRDFRYIWVNDRLAEMNGLSVEENTGKTVREVVPDIADAAEEMATRIFITGEPVFNVPVSGTTRKLPGIERCWVQHWLPFNDHSGSMIGINVAVEEITGKDSPPE